MTDSIINEDAVITTKASGLQYLLREPLSQTKKKKVIILLHGVGSNEADLFGLADQLPKDFYIISVRGQYSLGSGRYAWYNVDFSTGKPVYSVQQETASRKILTKFVERVKQQYQLDEVYLGGFSQGAIMSYTIGLTNPDKIQGVIALGGRVLDEIKPVITKSADLHQLNIFIAHGIQDNTLPINYAREAKTYLELLEVPLSYHEYPMGHQITAAVISDLNTWLNK